MYLHIPNENELDYRKYLISDEATMDYNIGYGENGGCTYHQTSDEIQRWYQGWNKSTDAYYAYIVRSVDNVFIGEVNLHKSRTEYWFDMGIVLEAKYRRMGYSVPSLKLLLRQAFDLMNVPAVHNDFEETRIAAVKAHVSAGFTKTESENGVVDLLITRERYYLNKAIQKMTSEIADILSDCSPSVYLYGSVALNDFRLGWSDIDILCLTQKPFSQDQADRLVNLRQHLLSGEPDNMYYRLFEGGILTLNSFLNPQPDRAVYWGTSGEKITDGYKLDSFSMAELLDSEKLAYGDDVRGQMQYPTYEMLKCDVSHHYETIRKYAVNVGKSIKSYGWLLDIARCIYTLRTGKIIAKTAAGEWALDIGACPVPDALEKAIQLRKDPLKYQNDEVFLNYTDKLGGDIQCFADVLEKELR